MKNNDKQLILTGFIFCTAFFVANVVAKGHTEESPVSVSTQPLSKLLISIKNSAPASIISLNNTILSAEITGRIKGIKAEVGDQVTKGQLLTTLDCRSYTLAKKQAKAALRVAEAQLNYSRKQFERNRALVKKGTIPRELFEKSESSKLIAVADIMLKKASIETADLAISRCKIMAPFSGQITKRLSQQGQLVTTGTPLFGLMQNNQLEIKAKLSPNSIKKIKKALRLEFVSGDIQLKAKIRSILQNIDETTRTQEVRLSYAKEGSLPAGLSGRLEWQNKEQKLPAEYIMRRGGKLGVFIAKNVGGDEGSVTTAQFYVISDAKEGQAEVVKLSKDSVIIIKNRFRLHHNQKIKIQN